MLAKPKLVVDVAGRICWEFCRQANKKASKQASKQYEGGTKTKGSGTANADLKPKAGCCELKILF